MIEVPDAAAAPRRRGVRLTDLDRAELFVIGHTGRRWETLGTLTDVAARLAAEAPDAGTGAPAPSTAPEPSPETAATH